MLSSPWTLSFFKVPRKQQKLTAKVWRGCWIGWEFTLIKQRYWGWDSTLKQEGASPESTGWGPLLDLTLALDSQAVAGIRNAFYQFGLVCQLPLPFELVDLALVPFRLLWHALCGSVGEDSEPPIRKRAGWACLVVLRDTLGAVLRSE